MRKTSFAFLLIATCFCACGASSKVVGTWQLDAKATIDGILAKLPNDEKSAPMRGMMETMMGKSTGSIEFRGDGTLTQQGEMMGNKSNGEGTWTEQDGVLTIKATDAGKEVSVQAKIDGGTMTLSMNQGPMAIDMIYRRK